MLVGKKENLLLRANAHSNAAWRIRRGAHQPAALAAERLDGRRGIHVGERRDAVAGSSVRPSRTSCSQHSSTWRDLGHVGHGAAGIQIGQHDLLAGLR